METYEIKKGRLIRCNIFSETMEIPDNVKEIGKYVFALNTTIKNIILPKCCTIIDKAAFFGCTELENISAEYVKSISESAFEECYKLENINVNSCLKSIGKYAFEKCYALNITGPDGCYAADYAYKNNIFFCPTGKDITENAKISVALIAKRKKAAEKIKPMLNLNMLILGGTGTGKSRFFVKPNLMMCNTSYVVTDPSAELVESCGKMLERMGYALKVFNIDNMEYSCNYNPFHYIRDFNGNVDENAVIKMINTFMMNTKGEGQGGEQFWEDCTRMLLSAVCFLLVETASEEQQNFSNVLDLIHKAKVIEGKEEEKSELDLMFDKRKEVSPNALSVQYYDEFKQAAGKTMQSILISTTTRLQCFKIEKVRNLTCTDNIELDTVGDRKTALFIIIPSTDNTYTFLAAMMYTQLFDSLYRRAISKFHGRLPYHVRFILDYIYDNGNFTAIDSTSFRNQLFDFDKIWSVIQLCSRDGSLKRVNNTITIPQKYLDEIEPNQREYAERMISEQYSRMLRNRRVNPLVQSLNDLKVAAEQNMEAIQKEKAEKAALKAAALQARAGRKPGISLNENSESENNGG